MYWYCFCLFRLGFSHVTYKDSFILNWCFVLAVPKTEKQSLEHSYKQILNEIRCCYMWDFLSLQKCSSILVAKCQQVWSTEVALQLAETNLQTTLERCLLWYGSFFWKSTSEFLVCKNQFNFQNFAKSFTKLVNFLLR